MVSSSVPARDPQPARQARTGDVAHEHPAVEQRLPDAAGVGEPAEQHEVRVARHDRQPERAQAVDDPVALAP